MFPILCSKELNFLQSKSQTCINKNIFEKNLYITSNKKKKRKVPTTYGVIALEKEMATHARILAWEIPWTEAPGGRRVAESQT